MFLNRINVYIWFHTVFKIYGFSSVRVVHYLFLGTSKILFGKVFTAIYLQGFSYLSEVGARGLLNLGKKHLDHQNWENLMQSKRINCAAILYGLLAV